MQVKSYLQLARFPMSLLLPTSAVTVSYLYINNGKIETEIIIPLLAAILGTGGMCALNDYVDLEADKLGASDRPLPSGKISIKNGLLFAMVLTILGMTVAGMSDQILVPVVGGISVLLGNGYNFKTKGRNFLGTLNFGLIMVCVTLLGIVQVTNEIYHVNILLYCLYVFMTAASNQISANFYDMKSDAIYGYHTIPNTFGVQKASVIVTGTRMTSLVVFVAFFITSNMMHVFLFIPLGIMAVLPIISYHFFKQSHDVTKAKTGFKFGILYTLLSFCTIILGIYIR